MRTTLDLDDRVLAAAKSRAHVRGISLGKAVSELALEGYEAEVASAPIADDGEAPTLPRVPGHVITDEMVEAALADD
ncbi:MAG: hypothetical protein ACRDN9_11675 [Streptosporangiaceae bacterium]